MDRLYDPLIKAVDGLVYTPEQFTADHLTNYGRIFQWTPRFVVQPATWRDAVSLVGFAREHGLHLSNRGSAHSQSQLAISDGGILLDMKSMNRILDVDEQKERVDSLADSAFRTQMEAQQRVADGREPLGHG